MTNETVIRAAACYGLVCLSYTMPGVFSQFITVPLLSVPFVYVLPKCLEHDYSSILLNRKAGVRLARRI